MAARGTAVKLHVIGPDTLMESFSAESPAGNRFLSLGETQEMTETWGKEYDCAGQHSSPGGLTPHEYAETTSGLPVALVSAAAQGQEQSGRGQ